MTTSNTGVGMETLLKFIDRSPIHKTPDLLPAEVREAFIAQMRQLKKISKHDMNWVDNRRKTSKFSPTFNLGLNENGELVPVDNNGPVQLLFETTGVAPGTLGFRQRALTIWLKTNLDPDPYKVIVLQGFRYDYTADSTNGIFDQLRINIEHLDDVYNKIFLELHSLIVLSVITHYSK